MPTPTTYTLALTAFLRGEQRRADDAHRPRPTDVGQEEVLERLVRAFEEGWLAGSMLGSPEAVLSEHE